MLHFQGKKQILHSSANLKGASIAQVNADRVGREGDILMGTVPRKAMAGIETPRSLIFPQDIDITTGKSIRF